MSSMRVVVVHIRTDEFLDVLAFGPFWSVKSAGDACQELRTRYPEHELVRSVPLEEYRLSEKVGRQEEVCEDLSLRALSESGMGSACAAETLGERQKEIIEETFRRR